MRVPSRRWPRFVKNVKPKLMIKPKKKKVITGASTPITLPSIGLIKEVSIADIAANENIQRIYPISQMEVDRMADNLAENGLAYPLTVVKHVGGLIMLDGERRRQALIKLGISRVLVIVKEVDEEDQLAVAILLNQIRRKNWVIRGQEVIHLLDYAKRHIQSLRESDDSIRRSNDWVAIQLGFKSQCRVDQLSKIVQYDSTLLSRVDSGEISFEDAYRKSISQPAKAPKHKGLNKDSFTCNCPLSENCSLLQNYLTGNKRMKGGRREAA